MKVNALFLAFICVQWPVLASSQSINIDLDNGGPPPLGGGSPSDFFGGAVNQPGRWNRVVGTSSRPRKLVDIAGMETSVEYSVNAYGDGNSGLSYNFAGNTGNFALLLNDVRAVGTRFGGGRNTFQFARLAPGAYDIVTYAVAPQGVYGEVPVTVWEATTNQTQVVTGPMPGNAFKYLVTHSIHRVVLPTGGDVHVDIVRPPGHDYTWGINGFQIVAYPNLLAGSLLWWRQSQSR